MWRKKAKSEHSFSNRQKALLSPEKKRGRLFVLALSSLLTVLQKTYSAKRKRVATITSKTALPSLVVASLLNNSGCAVVVFEVGELTLPIVLAITVLSIICLIVFVRRYL